MRWVGGGTGEKCSPARLMPMVFWSKLLGYMEHPLALFPDLGQLITTVVVNLLRLLPIVLLLAAAERAWGRLARRLGSPGARTDFGYLLLTLLYAPLARHFATLLVGVLVIEQQLLNLRVTSFAGLPVVVQVLTLLLIRDICIYARHRAFHSRRLWPFHAVHHSSTEVNWLSTVRFHPGEALIEVSLNLVIFAALGPSSAAILVAATLMGAYDYFVHADLPIRYGPLGYILVSPVFHRWHHSSDPGARNKNFAAMFSFLDLLGGTYFMPTDRLPTSTGLGAGDAAFPRSLWGQLCYPFQRGKR